MEALRRASSQITKKRSATGARVPKKELLAVSQGAKQPVSFRLSALGQNFESGAEEIHRHIIREFKTNAFKLALPHIALFVSCFVYILLGAVIFQAIEGPHQNALVQTHARQLAEDKERLLEGLYHATSRGEKEFREQGEMEFEQYVVQAHKHQQVAATNFLDVNQMGKVAHPLESLRMTIFFVASTLTTIGYGNIVPQTPGGRLFVILFGIIGFPLVLVTIADLAKFVSAALTRTYMLFLMVQASFFQYVRRSINVPAQEDEDEFAQFIWDNLDNVHWVRLPTFCLFALIVGYCAIGAYLFSWIESWSELDALYFSMVSLLKIGFGDFVPSNREWLLLSLGYIFLGLIIATACIDVAGVAYLIRLHYVGRQIGEADYLALLKRGKRHRRNVDAMQQMFQIVGLLNKATVPKDDEIDKVTPGRPLNFRATEVKPHSISVAWDPPLGMRGLVTYTLKCKMQRPWYKRTLHRQLTDAPNVRHRTIRRNKLIELVGHFKDITDTSYQVKDLTSFSIYEFTLVASNRHGSSHKARIVQITEPETAPQDLRAEIVGCHRIHVYWEVPLKKEKDVKNYIVYYTADTSIPYGKWAKLTVEARHRVANLDCLEPGSIYAISVAANYGKGHSPISRSLLVKTWPSDTSEIEDSTISLTHSTDYVNQTQPSLSRASSRISRKISRLSSVPELVQSLIS